MSARRVLGAAALVISISLTTVVQGGDRAGTEVDRLIRAARIYDQREMAGAIDSLVAIGGPAVPALRRALDDFDDNVRWQVVVALGRIGSPARPQIPAIARALDDIDSDVRAAAAEALGRLHATDAAIIRRLKRRRSDEHGIVRASANWSLWMVERDAAYLPSLIGLFSSSDWIVTDRAVRHLSEIGEPAVPRLIRHLKDPAAAGRHHAARVLERIVPTPPQAVPVLIELLGSSDPRLVQAAGQALGGSGRSGARALVLSLGTHPHRAAIDALGQIGAAARESTDDLAGFLSHEDTGIQLAAVRAFGQIGRLTATVESRLVKLLAAGDEDVRGAACAALGKLGARSSSAVIGLERVRSSDRHDFVRQAAAAALARISQPMQAGSMQTPHPPALRSQLSWGSLTN